MTLDGKLSDALNIASDFIIDEATDSLTVFEKLEYIKRLKDALDEAEDEILHEPEDDLNE